jgi:hypothetical protein
MPKIEEVHMRTDWKVAVLSLALVLAACGRRQEQTPALSDDLKKDLAAASVAGGDLAIAQQSYRRMRFVSDIEQSRASMPAKRPKISHHPVQRTASHQPASEAATDLALDPVASMAAESPAPVSTPTAPAPEASIVIAQRPSPEPASSPAGSSDGGVGARGHGGGLGGLLGGIIGAVVIRGGHGGIDKCDPRTDGRARPTIIDRPDFGMPLPTGETFPGSRRR